MSPPMSKGALPRFWSAPCRPLSDLIGRKTAFAPSISTNGTQESSSKAMDRNSNLGHHTGQANTVRGINADQIRLASCTQSCFPVAQSDGKERKEKAHISNIFNCLHLSAVNWLH
ncbi:hypothetical protein TNCV_570091 [Trichonephila clavipes]|nr:hypothetical protein TNCV_570091 [Trichonephila clavipes]